jgi:hypothetical protein
MSFAKPHAPASKPDRRWSRRPLGLSKRPGHDKYGATKQEVSGFFGFAATSSPLARKMRLESSATIARA